MLLKSRLLLLVLSGWVLGGGVCSAAIAFVQRAAPNGATTSLAATAVTTAIATTTGDVLLCGIEGQSNTISSVTDTAGNTYLAAVSDYVFSNNRLSIWYAYNITGNASNVTTVTYSSAQTYESVACYEFSGFGASDPLDGTATNNGSGTSVTSGSVSVTGSEDVIFAFGVTNAAGWVAGTGYSLTDYNVSGDATKYFAHEYHIVTASEAATATVTSAGWAIVAAAFKGTGGGGGGSSSPCILGGGILRPGCPGEEHGGTR